MSTAAPAALPATTLPLAWRLRVLGTVAVVPPLLHFVSLHRVASRVRVRPASATPPPVHALVREVDRWLDHLPRPWRTTCLKRAGVLYSLMRRGGIDVELHIGVKRDSTGALAAHAWLVRDGRAFFEHPASPLGTFQVIARFPESAAA